MWLFLLFVLVKLHRYLFSRHSNGRIFSCRGLKICIDYFLKRSHKVVAFVPQFRRSSCHSAGTKILDDLEKQGLVSFTPSRKIGNRLVVAYDDRCVVRLILDTACTYTCLVLSLCDCLEV